MNIRKTKIVATLGPASAPKKVLQQMIEEGLDVARINFSHGSHEDHLKNINTVRELNKEMNKTVAILGDLQGPKLRVGEVENNGVKLNPGDKLEFTTTKCVGTAKKVYMSYQSFPQDTNPGEIIMIDDGKLHFKVLKSNGKDTVIAEAINGGILKSRKGVNLPNTAISQPSLTEKDLEDLTFALEHDIDWIGLSFVRSARDIIELRHVIAKHKRNARIIAKIEKPEALDDITEIIKNTDAVMVARGDLGVEVPMQKVPLIQKNLIKMCRQHSKPVIVATQMMESMIDELTPTRAEVNDVANAVMDGADAVMLSGETSVGKHPQKVVEAMRTIVQEIEGFEGIYHHETPPQDVAQDRFVSDSICYNACRLAQRVEATGITTMTYSGYSAIKIASQRPKAQVFVFTGNPKLLTTLNLVWGVTCFYYDKFVSTDHTFDDILYLLKKNGWVEDEDFVINVASMPITDKGMANTIKLSQIN